MPKDQNISATAKWERKIRESNSFADLFIVLLEMRDKSVSVLNSRGNSSSAQELARIVYLNSYRILHSINQQQNTIVQDHSNRITRSIGLRDTVERLFITALESPHGLSESVLPEALPALVIGETPSELYRKYNMSPRQIGDISFDGATSLTDLFSRLYELQSKGKNVISKGENEYDPLSVAKKMIKCCGAIRMSRAKTGIKPFDSRDYREELKAIPSVVRKPLMVILEQSQEISIPPRMAELVLSRSYQQEPNDGYDELDDAPTEMPQAFDHQKEGRSTQKPKAKEVVKHKKRSNWQTTAMICAAGLVTGAATSWGLKKFTEHDGQQEVGLSEDSMTPAQLKEMELKASDPIEWHDLNSQQLEQVKVLLERGQKYYLPFAIALIQASNPGKMMTKDGILTTDPYEAVADLKIVNHDLENYYDLGRIRGFTVDLGNTSPGHVLGRMDDGGTSNDISDDRFAIYLPGLVNNRLAPWVLYHEDAHAYVGGAQHIEPVASLPREDAAFSNAILETRDYAYYTTALMGAVDDLREYHQEVVKQKMRQANTLEKKQQVYESYTIKKRQQKQFAEYLAQLFFDQNTSLVPFGVTQKELTKVIETSQIFELLNEDTERLFEEFKKEGQQEKRERKKNVPQEPRRR